MSETEVKQKFVTLVNAKGQEEQAWDFENHIENLLSMGWTRPGSNGERVNEEPGIVRGNPGAALLQPQNEKEPD